jgi:ABC-type branched-subunit amino acid transport system substrate-binding protein
MTIQTNLLGLVIGTLAPLAAAAQILIGQTAGFSSPAEWGVNEAAEGARLYLEHVNKRGGVHGQTIELVALDDGFVPSTAADNARKLIVEKHVLALFMSRGTPHTQAIQPLLTQYKIPLVAPSTGAMALQQPVDPWIFNVRAPYQRESEKAVQHLVSIGLTRIGVIRVDDSFGEDCMLGAMRGFDKVPMRPEFVLTFKRDKPDFTEIAEQVARSDVQAVLFIGASASVAEGTTAIRANGSNAQIVTLSNNASAGFIKLMGSHAAGTIVTQVFPHERSLGAPIVKEAFDLASHKGVVELTPAMLEGYAGAKVLVEGLKRAGPNPTPQKLRDALERMGKVDIGGLEVDYGPKNHGGLKYVELSIISTDGKFRR